MAESFSLQNKKARILVVDDMGMSRATGRKLLMKLGFERIGMAVDGEDAWNQLLVAVTEGDPYLLVMSDWMMPVLDGLGLMRRIGSSGWSKTPNVILSTAESDAGQVAEAVKLGISAYIKKPLTEQDLMLALKRVDHANLNREREKSNG